MAGVRGQKVLIVEDEFLLAEDMCRYFEMLGAEVLGPVANLQDANEQVAYADAAVLDIDLNGQKVFPIADALERRKKPFVFFSGRGDIAIPDRFRHVGYLSKPLGWSSVFAALYPPDAKAVPPHSFDDVLATLPKLRLTALLLMQDGAAADRLVELTLERALAELETREDHDSLDAWLSCLLEDTRARSGNELML